MEKMFVYFLSVLKKNLIDRSKCLKSLQYELYSVHMTYFGELLDHAFPPKVEEAQHFIIGDPQFSVTLRFHYNLIVIKKITTQ